MDLENLSKIVEEHAQQIKELTDKINELEKKKTSTPRQNKNIAKNIDFEEAFEKCKKASQDSSFIYPCMYLPKSGKNKGKCCGSESVFYDDKDGKQVKITGVVAEEFYHSVRCNPCQNKGRANSESKKKCNEKIKGINVESAGEVNEKALSFLSGNTSDIISPTRALAKEKTIEGKEVEKEDCYHYLLPHDSNYFIFEYTKNKNGSPCIKKTPTLRGYINNEEIDEDNYENDIEEDIPETIFKNIKKVKKFKFDGNIIKEEKEEPIVPQLKAKDEEEEEEEEIKLNNDEMDKILEGLDIE